MSSVVSWLEKYRPKTFKDYLNYKDYKKSVEEWITPFLSKTKTSKPFLVLYGPPAYGKTTLAHCIFHEYDYEPLECNASDTRNKTQIQTEINNDELEYIKKFNKVDEEFYKECKPFFHNFK